MAWSLEEAVERHREASREALDDLGATGGILALRSGHSERRRMNRMSGPSRTRRRSPAGIFCR